MRPSHKRHVVVDVLPVLVGLSLDELLVRRVVAEIAKTLSRGFSRPSDEHVHVDAVLVQAEIGRVHPADVLVEFAQRDAMPLEGARQVVESRLGSIRFLHMQSFFFDTTTLYVYNLKLDRTIYYKARHSREPID